MNNILSYSKHFSIAVLVALIMILTADNSFMTNEVKATTQTENLTEDTKGPHNLCHQHHDRIDVDLVI